LTLLLSAYCGAVAINLTSEGQPKQSKGFHAGSMSPFVLNRPLFHSERNCPMRMYPQVVHTLMKQLVVQRIAMACME
jgi:hypothetical protein